jgi:Tfp pilus assembly protein PilN
MIRINLIPPEILGKRRDERRRRWVWLSGGVLLLIVGAFALLVFFQVASATNDVAAIQQQAQAMQAQTNRFDVFQQKEADLRLRQGAVSAATAGRIDWAELLYELGLVLPRDVYLTTFTGTDNAGGSGDSASSVSLAGIAVPDADKTPQIGYKSIAKVLVRLTEMTQLDNVWLQSAALHSADDVEDSYEWSVSARITPSATQTASSGQ